MYDSGGLEILTEEECRELINGVHLGRVIFTDRALPAIQPVNFVISRGDVIIRTSSGSKLAAAARNAVVAFEVDDFDPKIRSGWSVDDFDPKIRSGWSVVIVGHARIVSEDGELSQIRRLPLRTWVPTDDDHFIAISPELISGRRLPELD